MTEYEKTTNDWNIQYQQEDFERGQTKEWVEADPLPTSYKWICPECGGTAYYPKKKGRKKCEYRYCPWCGSQMKGE